MKPLLTLTKRNDVAVWILTRAEGRTVNPPWVWDDDLQGYWLEYFTDAGLVVEVLTVFNAFEVERR